MMSKITLVLSLALFFASLSDAFQPSISRKVATYASTRAVTVLNAKIGSDEEEDFPGGDSYKGEVDWDEEWKKVVKEKGQDIGRPGKDFYKNDAQRAALKVTKAAGEQIKKVKVVKPDVNLKMLAGDAKFWIAICE